MYLSLFFYIGYLLFNFNLFHNLKHCSCISLPVFCTLHIKNKTLESWRHNSSEYISPTKLHLPFLSAVSSKLEFNSEPRTGICTAALSSRGIQSNNSLISQKMALQSQNRPQRVVSSDHEDNKVKSCWSVHSKNNKIDHLDFWIKCRRWSDSIQTHTVSQLCLLWFYWSNLISNFKVLLWVRYKKKANQIKLCFLWLLIILSL